jgi:hypothetical protein
LFAEQYLEQLHTDRGEPTEYEEGAFSRAVIWWMEYEEWGDAAFPNVPKILREQPWEWVRSVEAVRAAQKHFTAYMHSSPEEQMLSEEGGMGRGSIGN